MGFRRFATLVLGICTGLWAAPANLELCAADGSVTAPAPDQPAKPKLKVLADGFPGGHDTPEGAACDLARAFIRRDAALFNKTCLRLYAPDRGPTEYATFLKTTAESIEQEAAKREPSPGGPKSIGKLFAARHLSKGGPASYGFALFGFQDVLFVDLGVWLHNGDRFLNRTLLIKDKDGKWYVHPAPQADPLLSLGLNDESESTRDFSDAYEVRK